MQLTSCSILHNTTPRNLIQSFKIPYINISIKPNKLIYAKKSITSITGHVPITVLVIHNEKARLRYI